uniref:Uncharacterized protein n=1 Tax=Trypanosoma congolense (strain IL3000) TaxID=1068625 RepID=G0UV55_TRYCI|nr:conserved hypothetical protein [Trypanosoma congolense IL3000]
MNESIIQVPLYVTTAAWRKEAQLRGLLRNHPSVIAHSEFVAQGVAESVCSTAKISGHNSESMLAIGLNPLTDGGGRVGLCPVSVPGPKLGDVKDVRWLDMPAAEPLSGLEWCDERLLVGTSRGRILVSEMSPLSIGDADKELRPIVYLTCGDEEARVGDIVVPPSRHAISTLVRSLHCNTSVCTSSLMAVRDCAVMMWDLKGATQPVETWTPNADGEKRDGNHKEIVMFAQWAPSTDSVVLTGGYNGSLLLTDVRAQSGSSCKLVLPSRRGYMARCADFNALLPFALAAASSDGIISVYDCRNPSIAVRTISSHQGDVMSLKYLKLHSDIVATGGLDGSVVLWNLRHLPTYCVGRAQYKSPVFDLAATSWSVEQHVIGVTCGGELTFTGLAQQALAALAVPIAEHIAKCDGPKQEDQTATDSEASLMEREALGLGFLYSRRIREAYEVIVDCAMKRFSRKEIAMTIKLVGFLDIKIPPKFDFVEKMRNLNAEKLKRELHVASTSHSHIIVAFDNAITRSSQWLFPVLLSDSVRDLERPVREDITRLEALQLNLLLHNILVAGCMESAIGGLQFFAASGGDLRLLDSETVCTIAKTLLKSSVSEGQRFVTTLLSLLIKSDGSVVAEGLAKRLLIVVQEPLVTTGMPSRKARRHESMFLSDLVSAKEAVEVQMEIRCLGIENHEEVIARVNKYQDQCLEKNDNGVFGWLAQEPLMLFLRSLTANSNYATFFWACVQLIEALAACPGMREVEELLLATVNSIHTASNRFRAQLQELAAVTRNTLSTLREAGRTLSATLDFVVVLLRVQLECENVALESNMTKLPPVLYHIMDILSSASSELLKAWEALLVVLVDCPLRSLVRKCCLSGLRDFALKVEGLVSLSAKEDGDEMLKDILDTCDEFFDKIVESAD